MTEKYEIGVDIGGTNLVVGVVPAEGGEPVALRSAATRGQRGPAAVVSDVGTMANAVISETLQRTGASQEQVVGIGIGCPGSIDLKAGVVLTAPNLGWSNYPMRDHISEQLELPATLDNDANCATYGEWWQGAGRGAGVLSGVTLGTGIGAGLIVDGRIIHGASGSAGEIGHTTIDFTGRRCACGNYGCLEAYASGPNIAARAREGLEAGYKSLLVKLVDGDLDQITAITVYDALVQGDDYAHEVMLETAKILGAGIANLVNTFNPEIVVIVGGVTRSGDHLFGPLRSEVRRRAFKSAVDACQIVPGKLTQKAGVIGAAGIVVATCEMDQ